MSSSLDLFADLASSTRIEILHHLNEQNLKLAQLAKKLDSSMQGLQRHVDRLVSSGLIQKDAKGQFSLSSIGKASLQQIPAFEFMSKNKSYFENHTFGDLPAEFIRRIGDLSNSKYTNSTMETWQYSIDLQSAAKEYLFGISHTVATEFFQYLIELLKKEVKFSAIFGENTIIPKNFFEETNKLDLESFAKKGLVQQKMIPKVTVTTVITESEAMVAFPKIDGQVDDSVIFTSKDKQFHKWCLDVFNHYWEKGGPFDPTKLQLR